jgi:tetratricopeptide (TPR) repeat protein
MRGAAQAEHLAMVRAERANIDAALAWTAGHDPLTGLRTANGFGWAWVVLGAGIDAARRGRAALAAARAATSSVTERDTVDSLLLTGWFEASGGDLDRATADVEEAIRIADTTTDEGLHGMGRLILAFVDSQRGRPREALDLLTGCRAEFRRLGLCWEEGAAWLLSAWAEIALGQVVRGRAACDEALRLLAPLGDEWALIHLEAMLGGLAQAEHRFADATGHLARAADAAHRLGFAAAGALHLTNLGRAQQQGADPQAAIATLERAIDIALAAGDVRIVALARARLGRVLRVLDRPDAARAQVLAARRWFTAAGGGDGALLADHLAAALDVDAAEPGAVPALDDVLAAARQAQDAEVELLTLDTQARRAAEQGRTADAQALLGAADLILSSVRHLVTDGDRTDRDLAVASIVRAAEGPRRRP